MQELYPGEPQNGSLILQPPAGIEVQIVPEILPQESDLVESDTASVDAVQIPAQRTGELTPQQQADKDAIDEIAATVDTSRQRELFARFFMKRAGVLHVIGMKYGIAENDRHDLIQDSWIRLQTMHERGLLRFDTRLMGYISTTMLNAVRDTLRRGEVRNRNFGSTSLEFLQQNEDEGKPTGLPHGRSGESEAIDRCQAAEVLSYLQDKHGADAAYVLLHVYGLGDKSHEVAAQLGAHHGTVKSRMNNFRKSTKEHFGEDYLVD